MPPKTRRANGQFGTEVTEKIETTEETIQLRLPRLDLNFALKVFMIVLVCSPWILLATRTNTLTTISRTVTNFYDDYFTCKNACYEYCSPSPKTPPTEKKKDDTTYFKNEA
jgi:hypothetical protein